MTNNLENGFNPKEKLDTNKNGRLDELDTLETQIGLSQLETQTINGAATRLFPQYDNEWKKIKDPEEKKGYVFLLQFGQKELGKTSFEELTRSLPLKEVSLFSYELLKAEQKKDLLTSAAIILTNEEITNLKKNILTKNYTQGQLGKLKEFIHEQLEQNVSSAELVKGTTLSKKLKENGKNPEKFMNNIDTVFFAYFTDKIPNISQDTTRNMATGLSLTLLKLYNSTNGKIPLSTGTALKDLQNAKLIKNGVNNGLNFLDKIELINEVINKTLNKTNSDKNELLMNPEKFSYFILKVVKSNLDGKAIKKEIIQNQKRENIKLDHKKLAEDTKNIFDKAGSFITKGQIGKVSMLAGLGEELKKIKGGIETYKKVGQKKVLEHADSIIGMKETLQSIGIWKYFKKLVSKLLQFLGFKNGWDDFEKSVEEKKFKNVIGYFKDNLTLVNIKKHEGSVFYKGFKDNLSGTKSITQIGVKGKLSYSALQYLNSLGADKKDLTKNLNKYFLEDNFQKLIKKAKIKDFEKNTFSVEDQTKNKKTIKVGMINMDSLSQVIEANIPKDFKAKTTKEKSNSGEGYTETAIISSYKNSNEHISNDEKINGLLEKEEKTFKDIVQNKLEFTNFSYIKYTNALSQIESFGGNYEAENKQTGALGKYQFMPNTLTDYKEVICPKQTDCNINEVFLNNPIIQEKVMAKYTLYHLNYLIKNKTKLGINNINDLIGLLGKAHFTGIGNLQKNYSDGNMSANTYASNTISSYNNVA